MAPLFRAGSRARICLPRFRRNVTAGCVNQLGHTASEPLELQARPQQRSRTPCCGPGRRPQARPCLLVLKRRPQVLPRQAFPHPTPPRRPAELHRFNKNHGSIAPGRCRGAAGGEQGAAAGGGGAPPAGSPARACGHPSAGRGSPAPEAGRAVGQPAGDGVGAVAGVGQPAADGAGGVAGGAGHRGGDASCGSPAAGLPRCCAHCSGQG